MADTDDEAWIIELFRVRGVERGLLRAGIGDDATVFADGRVVTVDTMVEGVHWDHRLDPADVGWKLVAVNVSDVAAMGGRPRWAWLAASVPSPVDRSWMRAFADGLGAAAGRWGVTVVGGDTTRSPVRTFSLTLEGHAPRPVLRSGGHPGDDLWVTGSLGLAAEAFLSSSPSAEATAWFRRPEPRVEFAAALAEHGLATAMMDLSDGLRDDLSRLCTASGCGADVDAALVPGTGPLPWRVGFGEDYELLFTAPQTHRDAVRSLATMTSTPLGRIGRLDAGIGARLNGRTDWPSPLFRHFSDEGGA
jgi:thiamine-monophosphate kinase